MSGRSSLPDAPSRPRQAESPLGTPVQYLKGVGPARAGALARLGVETVEDLLYHVPRRHEDRSRLTSLKDLVDGTEQTVEARVLTISQVRPRRGLTLVKAALGDETAVAYAVWFNQPYIREQLRRGMRALFFGRVERRQGQIQIQSPEFELLESEEEETWHTGRIVPIYPATEGLTQRVLRTLVRTALTDFASHVVDPLPQRLVEAHGFSPIGEALWSLHFPETLERQAQARTRLAFEELLVLQTGILLRRARSQLPSKPFHYKSSSGGLLGAFVAGLPYELTAAQRRAVQEILADMRAPAPMNRLLQGDVGSGKTVVALAGLLTAVEAGHQGALMAPTEILAEQHYLTLKAMLTRLGVRTALLTGGNGRKSNGSREAVRRGEADIAIGTHALIQEHVVFADLALAVVDEQHKFGVMQRAQLRRKGFAPDVLVMTATPIPRTLALTLYGDLDVTVIDELPAGRLPVATYWRPPSSREKIYEFVRGQVDGGRQAYVVCPLIEESEKLQAQAAVTLVDELRTRFFSDFRVALLHGRMPPDEKDAVMASMRDGTTDVLVATPVIEVGIDVPNATVMVIESAERFGLAQLHQLRGRVGRGAHKSYCVLVAATTTREAKRRMEVLAATSDGFRIAQEDLQLRGPGEIMGTRQHGLPDLRVADLLEDTVLLEEARQAAADILREDRELRRGTHRGLREAVGRRFGRSEMVAAIS